MIAAAPGGGGGRDVVFRLTVETDPRVSSSLKSLGDTFAATQSRLTTGLKDSSREFESIAGKSSETIRKVTAEQMESMRRSSSEHIAQTKRAGEEIERTHTKTAHNVANEWEKANARIASGAARIASGFDKATHGAMSLARGIAYMSASGEKDLQKMLDTLLKVEAGLHTAKGVMDLAKGGYDIYSGWKSIGGAAAGAGAAGGAAKGMAGIGGIGVGAVGPLAIAAEVTGGAALLASGTFRDHLPSAAGGGLLSSTFETAARGGALAHRYTRGLSSAAWEGLGIGATAGYYEPGLIDAYGRLNETGDALERNRKANAALVGRVAHGRARGEADAAAYLKGGAASDAQRAQMSSLWAAQNLGWNFGDQTRLMFDRGSLSGSMALEQQRLASDFYRGGDRDAAQSRLDSMFNDSRSMIQRGVNVSTHDMRLQGAQFGREYQANRGELATATTELNRLQGIASGSKGFGDPEGMGRAQEMVRATEERINQLRQQGNQILTQATNLAKEYAAATVQGQQQIIQSLQQESQMRKQAADAENRRLMGSKEAFGAMDPGQQEMLLEAGRTMKEAIRLEARGSSGMARELEDSLPTETLMMLKGVGTRETDDFVSAALGRRGDRAGYSTVFGESERKMINEHNRRARDADAAAAAAMGDSERAGLTPQQAAMFPDANSRAGLRGLPPVRVEVGNQNVTVDVAAGTEQRFVDGTVGQIKEQMELMFQRVKQEIQHEASRLKLDIDRQFREGAAARDAARGR